MFIGSAKIRSIFFRHATTTENITNEPLCFASVSGCSTAARPREADDSHQPKYSAHTEQNQRHGKEAAIPAGANSRLPGIVRVIPDGVPTTDRELGGASFRLLIALAFNGGQFNDDRLRVNCVEHLQRGGIELLVAGRGLRCHIAAQHLRLCDGPAPQHSRLRPEERNAEENEQTAQDQGRNPKELEDAPFLATHSNTAGSGFTTTA